MKNVQGNQLVLEPSTNTHVMINANGGFDVTDYGNGIMKIINKGGKAMVQHGEHGTIGVDSKVSMKYVQQEYNPISKKMQIAWD